MINRQSNGLLKHFPGATARRVKMHGTNGTSDIPPITPAAEELSKLKTLKEIREKWSNTVATNNYLFTPPTGGLFGLGTITAPTGGLFGLGKVRTPRRRATMTKKRAATLPK